MLAAVAGPNSSATTNEQVIHQHSSNESDLDAKLAGLGLTERRRTVSSRSDSSSSGSSRGSPEDDNTPTAGTWTSSPFTLSSSTSSLSSSTSSLFSQDSGASSNASSSDVLVVPPPTGAWQAQHFSLKLFFTAQGPASRPSSPSLTQHTSSTTSLANSPPHQSLPPALFPRSAISFSPHLVVHSAIAFSSLGGLHLGVTGMCEILGRDGQVTAKRLVADYVTDLSSGLQTWLRDAAAARSRNGECKELPGFETLPVGTYVLPLSMKLPNAEQLPPSFACETFRIAYTMSIALVSAAVSSTSGKPLSMKVFSTPFEVLPSTTPLPAPHLAVLRHDVQQSLLGSFLKSLSGVSSLLGVNKGSYLVQPYLPTSAYSPGHVIPLSLRIQLPIVPASALSSEPAEVYIKVSLLRKIYRRVDRDTDLEYAISNQFGLGEGVTAELLGMAEERVMDEWCRETEECSSRWGIFTLPAASTQAREVRLDNITLPIGGERPWEHGYSTGLNLTPTVVPADASSSWFSPALRARPPVKGEYATHLHLSSRFYVAIEMGFSTEGGIGSPLRDSTFPPLNTFSAVHYPGSTTSTPSNPFGSTSASRSGTLARASFPGKVRELLIPITIGSVAEPSLACIVANGMQSRSESHRAQYEAEERLGERERCDVEHQEGAWIIAPPRFVEALRDPPAYVL